MGQGYSTRLDGAAALARQQRKAKRTTDNLRNQSPFPGTISRPGSRLIVQDSSGTELMVMGDLGNRAAPKLDGSAQQGWILRRDSGELVGTALTNVAGGLQSWNFTNRQGDGIVSDDAVSGDSLATPYIPLGAMVPLSTTSWEATTSGSYGDLYGCQTYRQHPWALFFGWVFAPTSTNGDIRVLVNGSQVGSAVSIVGNSAAIQSWQVGAVAVGTGWHQYLDIRVQARRTAGAGSFALVPLVSLGMQSF